MHRTMNSLRKEGDLVKKRFFGNLIKGSTGILCHISMVGGSAALALSLPTALKFISKKFLTYWSFIGNDKIFFISIEMILTLSFLLLSTWFRRMWKDRRLSNMAKTAGIVFVTPAKGFLAQRRIRKLKARQGLGRDVMVITSTGFRTFVDPKSELHEVIQNCRQAKIMLLNPQSEGAAVRAKSIPIPDVTPESFGEQIRKSIDFLKTLKSAQKNVRLKLFHDPPFLKMTILGDYIWLQYYQTGLDVQMMPKYVFKHDPNTGSLYTPFYQYFLERWNNPDLPEYDMNTDELIYRDAAGNEVRRERTNQARTELAADMDRANLVLSKKDGFMENGTHRVECREGGFFASPQQNLHSGLHPGGKEFFLLRSKNPVCEAAGWMAV
jgi:hypothetical protein